MDYSQEFSVDVFVCVKKNVTIKHAKFRQILKEPTEQLIASSYNLTTNRLKE